MTLSASLQRCRGQGFPPWLPAWPWSFLPALRVVLRALHNERAEALLTVTFALPASFCIFDAAALIKEEIHFFLHLFRHSRHTYHLHFSIQECLKSKNVHNKRCPYPPRECMIPGRKWTLFFAVTNYIFVNDDWYLIGWQRGNLTTFSVVVNDTICL